jgi:hypothetical protein
MVDSCTGDNIPARTSARVSTDGAVADAEFLGEVDMPEDKSGSDRSDWAFDAWPGATGGSIV